MRPRRNVRSRWVWLGDEACDDDSSPWASRPRGGAIRLQDVEIHILAMPSKSSRADRAADRMLRRRPDGIVLCLTLGGEASPTRRRIAADILGAMIARQPRLHVVVALIDPALPEQASRVLGGACADWDQGVRRILEQAARQTLDRVAADSELTLDDGLLELPSIIRDRVPAWATAVEPFLSRDPGRQPAGLHISASPFPPDALEATLRQLTPRRGDGGRRLRLSWLRWAGLTAVGVGLAAAAAGIWWTVDETARHLMRDSAIVLQAEAATTSQVSGAGLAALGRIVGMIDRRETKLFLVPSSWSKDLEDVLLAEARDAIGALLLEPVRRQLEARLGEIDAQAEALGHERGASAIRRATALLRDLIALQRQGERFRLAAAGTLRSQWEALLVETAPDAPLALDWVETPVGGALMADAVARYDWKLEGVEPVAARILAAAVNAAKTKQADLDERLAAAQRLSQRVESAVEALGTSEETATTRDRDPLAELAETLSGLRAQGEAIAAEYAALRDAIEEVSAMRPRAVSGGVPGQPAWRAAIATLEAILSEERKALRGLTVARLGPLFAQSDRVAPVVVSAAAALERAAGSDLTEGWGRTLPDIGRLAMVSGAPDAARISAAAGRLRRLQSWMKAGDALLPPDIRRPVSTYVTSRAVRAAAIDATEAYRNVNATGEGIPAYRVETVADLKFVLLQLAKRSERLGADLAWLAGVRAHRDLEALDAAFERRNVFSLAQVIRAWDGRRPLLAVKGWRTRDERRARMAEGWRRVAETARQAAAILGVLDTPPVRAALAPTRLVQKWRGLSDATAAPGEEGYGRFGAFVENTLAPFTLSDCSADDGSMARPPSQGGPLGYELARIADALDKRCKELLDVPTPRFKPAPPAKNGYKRLPW